MTPQRTRSIGRLLGPAFALLLLAACGGSGSGAAPTTAHANGSGPAATSGAVTIKGFAFEPGVVKVKAGSTVTFTNRDQATHTATADDGSFDTKSLKPGASKTVTLGKVGTVTYHCSIHPTMTAEIDVT